VSPRWPRAAFALYALALFVATHWPRLRVEGPVPRSDLYAHVLAFSLWTFLAAAAAWFGPTLGRRNILGAGVLGVVYAALDEGLQAIPLLHRTAAWDDLGADVAGVVLAAGALALFARVRGRPRAPSRTTLRSDEG
jgi:VanZ family protein